MNSHNSMRNIKLKKVIILKDKPNTNSKNPNNLKLKVNNSNLMHLYKNNNVNSKLFKPFFNTSSRKIDSYSTKVNSISSIFKNNKNPRNRKYNLIVRHLKSSKETEKNSSKMAFEFHLKKKILTTNSDIFDNTFYKDPIHFINRIILDYRNVNYYNDNLLENMRNVYNKHIEDLENRDKLKEDKTIRRNLTFEKLKNDSEFHSFNRTLIPSIKGLIKLKVRNPIAMMKKIDNEQTINQTAKEALKRHNKFIKRKFRKNSLRISNDIKEINCRYKLYEKITKDLSLQNLFKYNFINKNNFQRLAKLNSIFGNYSDEDDFENNFRFIHNFNKEYSLIVDKIISGNHPKYIKSSGFKNKTIRKYNQLQSNYFGFRKVS